MLHGILYAKGSPKTDMAGPKPGIPRSGKRQSSLACQRTIPRDRRGVPKPVTLPRFMYQGE